MRKSLQYISPQSGNALFLILIAVALFAALSYAVTQSSRGGASIAKEQEMIDTAVLQQCEASVDQGIMRLKVVGGCSQEEISYELADGTNENLENPDDTSCFLFDSDGAGVTPCGPYLDPLIPLGTITEGDTTTVALMSAGYYFRCDSWGSYLNKSCTFGLSTDGVNFVPNGFCYDNSECTHAINCIPLNDMCNSACGGTYINAASSPGPSTSVIARFYPDGTSSTDPADISGCNMAYDQFRCDCW